ncbi:MAG: mycofactocin biosynthesis peptidyl-dipeptidase MftE [Acidobacteria bacterium]|nr:mycofactocin biosynthesis peptidyl-dipeptidase MftE [Acidobacteriota bacterium]
MRLGDLTWPEAAARAATSLLAVPVGSTEQHGPHLPLSTDTDIASALADALADRRNDVLVAPEIAYGSSGEHAAFVGTLSIGQAVTEWTLLELVRSADAFAGVVLVCGHGGNAGPINRSVRLLGAEGRRVLAWFPRVEHGDAHAGATETSLMLALGRPVRTARIEVGATAPVAELADELRAGGVAAVSANGVLGDPTAASVADGRQLFAQLTSDLVASVAAWQEQSPIG